jgi:hypothetical protein
MASSSQINKLRIIVNLDYVQTLIKITIKTLTESIHLLIISIHIIVPILTETIEILSILIDGVRSLFEMHQLPHFSINEPLRDIVFFESLFEFRPSDPVAFVAASIKNAPTKSALHP